jgi:hypothetical protein
MTTVVTFACVVLGTWSTSLLLVGLRCLPMGGAAARARRLAGPLALLHPGRVGVLAKRSYGSIAARAVQAAVFPHVKTIAPKGLRFNA